MSDPAISQKIGELVGTVQMMIAQNAKDHENIFGRLLEIQKQCPEHRQQVSEHEKRLRTIEEAGVGAADGWMGVAGRLATSSPIAAVLIYAVYRVFEMVEAGR